jgi:SPP1 family predicted phage head-tail adaptor
MNVNPGEFRQRIKFVKVEDGYDENGFPIKVEATIYECQAKVTNTSGTEKIKSGAEVTDVNTRFLMRYTNLINADLMIKFNSNYYDITYINDYEFKHEYTEVFANLQKQV